MTSHGITDDESPFEGSIKPSRVKEIIYEIEKYNNESNLYFSVKPAFTIGKWNLRYSKLAYGFDYCEDLGVKTIKFNDFLDKTINLTSIP